MPTHRTFPDAEAVASVAMRNANLPGLLKRVYSSIPKTPTYPLAVVQRIGGVPPERHALDRARIQVDVWGTSKTEAHDFAQQLRVVLHQLEGTTTVSPDAYVHGVEDVIGVTWAPDPVTDRDRYIFTVYLYLH